MQIAMVRHMRLPLVILVALAAVVLLAQTPLIDQGRAANSRGDTAAAVGILEKAAAQSPNSPEAHFYLANAYLGEGEKAGMLGAPRYASKAKDELEKAVALNPKYLEARFALVQLYAAAPGILGGSSDKAFEQAKEIKAIDPVAGHRAFAIVYTQQKKPGQAKQEYVDAIREQPKSAKAHNFFGQYLGYTEKNYAGAFAEFETALKVDASYMPAFYHLGRTAAQSNTNLARGEEALRKYVAYTPKENEPTLARAHYFLGAIYENEGKKAEARQSYEAALKLNPSLKEASEGLKRVS